MHSLLAYIPIAAMMVIIPGGRYDACDEKYA